MFPFPLTLLLLLTLAAYKHSFMEIFDMSIYFGPFFSSPFRRPVGWLNRGSFTPRHLPHLPVDVFFLNE